MSVSFVGRSPYFLLLVFSAFIPGLVPEAVAGPEEALFWSYDEPGALPEDWNGIICELDESESTPDGGPSLKVTPLHALGELRWPPYLVFSTDTRSLLGVGEVEISCWAKSDSSARISMRVTNENARPFSETQRFDLRNDWEKIEFSAPLTETVSGKWASVPRLIFSQYEPGESVYLGPLTVRFVGSGLQEDPSEMLDLPKGWIGVDMDNLYIQQGSALDFTEFGGTSQAGIHGRVIANSSGELAFADQPNAPVRFLSLQWIPRFPPGFRNWSDEQIESFAAAVARQGYNMVRFHFLDDYLSGNNRAAALKSASPDSLALAMLAEDVHWDEKALDRTHYLMAQLKEHGIYWNIDLMTTYVGHGNDQFILNGSAASLENAPFNTKVQMYVNPMFRSNWKAGARKLLNEVNPYTGLAPKEDPALAIVMCLNEQEILLPHREYGSELNEPWHVFLTEKYGDYENLREAWAGKCGSIELPESGRIDTDVPSINRTALSDTQAGLDMARFVGEMEVEMSEFYLSFLKELEYEGLVTNWNMRTRIGSVPARSLFPVVSMNQYHAHPKYIKGGAIVSQDSALASGGNSFKGQSVARFLDRPFLNTEFGHLFWNRYRHEQGILHGAGAALQGWGALTRHGNQVVDEVESMSYFNAGYDPISRASEVQAAFLFRRGDVRSSPHTIEIPLTDDYIFREGRALRALDDELARMWPLSRIGITYGEPRVEIDPDLVVLPGQTAEIKGDQMFSVVEDASSRERIERMVGELRELQILGPENRTDPAAGIYESDTGEVLVRTGNGGEMMVETTRFLGAVMKFDRPLSVGPMQILRCTEPASISLISIDSDRSRGLPDSRRILLVLATDARNYGMEFTDATEDTASSMGELPVLLQTAELKVLLSGVRADLGFKLFALGMDGSRRSELPISVDAQGRLLIELDTQDLGAMGGTPFFEVVREDWDKENE
ncbi:beta-galactosidase [Puniceicoccus vermicola]|uniref:Beta-galactosidase n=1 Tax=Puniceicoccus vermicola TaxID=388746 RepID=A0A7X1E541_9BACT|nr:beta-galactosidase [Puniceicoccus vermicola]MBC2602643.1 beta-galactosidase [Puniceicoccus vermicola]